jgi:acyl-CoA thioester hydrolase
VSVADEVVLPLRWRDLDAFGHVYHGEYLTLLDEARSRWFGSVLGIADPEVYVVAHLEIDYVSRLAIEDREVRVACTLQKVGTTSLTLAEVMRAGGGREVARSRTVAVLWDRAGARPRPLADDVRQRAAAHLPA